MINASFSQDQLPVFSEISSPFYSLLYFFIAKFKVPQLLDPLLSGFFRVSRFRDLPSPCYFHKQKNLVTQFPQRHFSESWICKKNSFLYLNMPINKMSFLPIKDSAFFSLHHFKLLVCSYSYKLLHQRFCFFMIEH